MRKHIAKLNHLVSLFSRLQLHAESTRIQGYIINIVPFCSAAVGSLALRRLVCLALPLARRYCHTHKHACTHTCVYTPISTLGRGETHTERLLNGREELRGKRDGESKHTREERSASHVQDQKVKRQISLLSPKEASPSERGVSRLRNRRETLLLW